MHPFRRFLRALFELFVAAIFCGVPLAVVRIGLRPALDRALAVHPSIASALGWAAILAAVLGGYWAFVRYFERRSPAELRPSWRAILWGALSGAALIALTISILFVAGFNHAVAYRGFGHVAGVVAVLFVGSTLEEFFFRALLFRLFERQVGTGWAVVAAAAVFGALHLTNPGVGSLTLLSVTLLGMLWTGVFVLSRNLWAAALNHVAWNVTIFLSGMPLSGEETWRPLAPLDTVTSGPVLITGGSFGPEDSLLSILITAVACLAVFRLARRRGQWVRRADVARASAHEA